MQQQFEPYQFGTQATQVAVDQNKVLRNTYGLLALSMVPTVVGALLGLQLKLFPSGMLGFLLFLGIAWGFMWGIQRNRDSGLGVALLLGFTFFMGVMLAGILQVALHYANGGTLVAMAAGGTGAIFFTLAGIAATTKRDFSFMGKFLFVGLVLLLLASLANIFFQIPAMSLAISAVAVLVFSGFILFDVSRVVTGGETNYVMATLAIYLDIYNLFVHLLNLLMALAGERD